MNTDTSFLKIKSYIDHAVSNVTHEKFQSLEKMQHHINIRKNVYFVLWILSAFLVSWLVIEAATNGVIVERYNEFSIFIAFVVGISIQLITYEVKTFFDSRLDNKLEKVLYHKVSLNGIEKDYKALTNHNTIPSTISIMQLTKILTIHAYSHTIR